MKCSICGKIVQHPYYLDGKIYGYNCYKQALSIKYTNLTELHNNLYASKCISAIEVFHNKIFKDQWNKDFKLSIVDQWNKCKKLTENQLNCIIKKFNIFEIYEFNLIFTTLIIDNKDYKACLEKDYILNLFKNNSDMLKKYKHDNRLHELIKNIRSKDKYYIVESKFIDEEDSKSICEFVYNKKINRYKEDEDLKILEIIEI